MPCSDVALGVRVHVGETGVPEEPDVFGCCDGCGGLDGGVDGGVRAEVEVGGENGVEAGGKGIGWGLHCGSDVSRVVLRG